MRVGQGFQTGIVAMVSRRRSLASYGYTRSVRGIIRVGRAGWLGLFLVNSDISDQ